jgi:hypothetical protein
MKLMVDFACSFSIFLVASILDAYLLTSGYTESIGKVVLSMQCQSTALKDCIVKCTMHTLGFCFVQGF